MVVTRSQKGDESGSSNPAGPGEHRTHQEPAEQVLIDVQGIQGVQNVPRPPVLEAFLAASGSGITANPTRMEIGESEEEVVSSRATESSQALLEGSRRSNTLRPNDVRSRRSAASRKKLLAELEAKEKLAESRLKQAKAEEELQRLKLQKMRLDDTSEEEEDDELESVRIQNWIERTPLRSQDIAPPMEDKVKEVEAAPQRQDEYVREIVREPVIEKCTDGPTRQSQTNVDVATLATALVQAAKGSRDPPKYLQELPFFNGNSSEWLGFKAAYEDSHKFFSASENVSRIRRSLKGTAKEAVGCLLFSQSDPKKIIEALERRFGRPESLIHAEIEKLKHLHKISDSPRELCVFAGAIDNIVGTIEALKKSHYLYNPELVRIVIEKLTPILRNKWYDYVAVKTEDIPDIKKLSNFLNEEADKCGAYALPEIVKEDRNFQDRRKRKEQAFTLKKEVSEKCPACEKQHYLTDCEKFKQATTEERWLICKKNNVCFRCIRSKHKRFVCKAPVCGQDGCQMRHHKLLHYQKKAATPEAVTSAREVTMATDQPSYRRAYLKIVPVVLTGPLTSVETFALLDEGSTVTLIDASIAEVIGADGPKKTMWLQGISTEVRHENSKMLSFKIKGKYVKEVHEVEAVRTVDRLNFASDTIRREDIEDCAHLTDIAEEIVYERATPKILIGQDNWHLIVTRELRVGKKNQPVASYTQLGWVLHGCQSSTTDTIAFCGNLKQMKRDEDMEELIKEHFKLESLGIEAKKPREDPERKALDILEEKSRRLPEGRYETGMLWKDKDFVIPNNYPQAEKRLHLLEKKLDRDEDLKEKYKDRMQNLLKSGYAEPAPASPKQGRTWYLPHFPVINPAKPHKPPRLVHDAAAKFAGMSLNDMLLSGPDLLQSLPGVIMRFRQYPYAVSADIKEMFMQIKIREEDRDTLRFLWRDDRREGEPDEYRMTSVIFGATSSPCTALYVKNRNAEDYQEQYPHAAEAIKKNHYMDDYLQSFVTIEEAIETTKAVDYVHKQAGFVLNGWTSNKQEILVEVEPEKHSNFNVIIGGKETEKALGLQWNVQEDCFSFKINRMKTPEEVIQNERKPSKREALSIIMALFDPLGYISPITMPAKRIFQDTWRYTIGWDEPIPEELWPRWQKWMRSLFSIENLRIPRCYDYRASTRRQLHTFVDASEEAYAAAVYWRSENNDGSITVALAAAKSKVTPLKPISIPRLELQAALLGARLAHTVLEEHEFEVEKKIYWSDSRTALAWIRSEPRAYKTFVAHRLAEIEDTTKKNEWRWLPTKENVADDATRSTPNEFDHNHRWFKGPAFLTLPEDQWPVEVSSEVPEDDIERKPLRCHLEREQQYPYLPQIDRFSKWTRLIRATAYVLLFIQKLSTKRAMATRKRTKKTAEKDPTWARNKKKEVSLPRPKSSSTHQRKYEELSAYLLMRAEKMWIEASQEDSFRKEKIRVRNGEKPAGEDRLASLNTYIDEEGILRLRGRVAAARNISEDQINPPVLDGKHRYTKLYVQYVHEKLHHGGVELVVNELRQRVWIIRIRPEVRSVIKSCIFCRIRRTKPLHPVTGDLPPARLAHHARPFTFTGLDYFGPMEVTVGRHKEKRYGALFTCMTSRAIHIEIAHSLSTDSAIAALRRFIARRGCPKEMWSDNATCFKGAEKELAEAALEGLQHEVVTHQIHWRYIPPASPFMGGAWERMVRAVKEALKTTLHEKYPSDETLATLLAEVENTVNSRPLTHVSVSPDEPEALTPNHILVGPNSHVPPPGYFGVEDVNARQQWRRAQALADIFWRRWVREYLPILQHRREPFNPSKPPEVGDFVVICDANLPRNTWPKGRIVRVYPGADGEVRVVDVQVGGGRVLQRPTKKIVVIPEVSPGGDGGRNVHDGT